MCVPSEIFGTVFDFATGRILPVVGMEPCLDAGPVPPSHHRNHRRKPFTAPYFEQGGETVMTEMRCDPPVQFAILHKQRGGVGVTIGP
jgi:hypothetical protein